MDKKIHSRLNAQLIGRSFIICFVAAVLFACGGGDTSSSQDGGEASGTPVDSAEIIDDDAYDKIDIVPIENKTISGLAQKGPLKKGSTVTIIELDGETLEETGKKITGTVLSDSGNYSISDVSLVSQYAIVEAYGQYRDEVYNSGIYPTQLRALVDLSSREKVNVNIMTTFIYKRIFNLYDSGMNFPAAKKKAEKEFLREFGFTGDIGDFEDLDILKMGDGDAALLATSILFTRDIINPDPSDDKIWKTAFTEDFTTDGKWDDEELKTQMADEIDTVHFVYTKYNIFNWELSSEINHFEIFVNKFMGKVYGLGECTDNRTGEVKRIENTLTNTLYTHYICSLKLINFADYKSPLFFVTPLRRFIQQTFTRRKSIRILHGHSQASSDIPCQIISGVISPSMIDYWIDITNRSLFTLFNLVTRLAFKSKNT